MDALRILTRSTNLARPSAKAAHAHTTPSAGEASNPQLFGDEPIVNTLPLDATITAVGNGKKRKRGQGEPTEPPAISKDLGFFNHTSVSKDSTAPQDVILANKRQQHFSGDVANLKETEPEQKSSEEECKRILRAHKIKITRLWAPPEPTEDLPAKKKKKEKSKSQRSATELPDQTTTKSKKQSLDIIPQPLTSFSQLRSKYNLPWKLVGNVEEQGYNVPTEVQLGSLPLLLGSFASDKTKAQFDELGAPGLDLDLLTVAPTGSGKTLAFLIPVLSAILKGRRLHQSQKYEHGIADDVPGPKAIIIAPTKELANQIVNEGRKLTKQTGLKVTLVRKGMRLLENDNDTPAVRGIGTLGEELPSNDNDEDDDEGQTVVPVVRSDVLVSTPLTLLHAITRTGGVVNALPTVQYLVLDEADVLLDALFREQTLKIWSACKNVLLRVNLWSATMGSSIEDLAKVTIEKRWMELSRAQTKEVERPQLVRLVVGLKDSAIPNISHKLVYAATEQGKLMALRQLLRPTAASASDGPALQPPFLVFTQTIPRAVALHSELLYDIPQEAGGSSRLAVLHADLSDSARERVMTRFRKGEIWVLITTDLLSRGVDFRGVNGVVNYDFPNSSAAYVHRVGRTGRAGREGGVAVTLYAKEDIPFVKNVANVIAASERQKGAKGEGKGIEQWLLDAMPKPSKKDKQTLKKRGVESRRTGYLPTGKGESAARMRISTKSGFDRKLENNRRGAKKTPVESPARLVAEDGDFSGFED